MKTASPRIQYLRELPNELGSFFAIITCDIADFAVSFWQTLVLGRSVEEQIKEDAK